MNGHRCAHCGREGVPLIEWQPDPPRPDIPGPFPLVCAHGCGLPAPGVEVDEQPFQLVTSRNLFVLNRVPNRFEREALMRFETWNWRERLGWRLRYFWARLRGLDRAERRRAEADARARR